MVAARTGSVIADRTRLAVQTFRSRPDGRAGWAHIGVIILAYALCWSAARFEIFKSLLPHQIPSRDSQHPVHALKKWYQREYGCDAAKPVYSGHVTMQRIAWWKCYCYPRFAIFEGPRLNCSVRRMCSQSPPTFRCVFSRK